MHRQLESKIEEDQAQLPLLRIALEASQAQALSLENELQDASRSVVILSEQKAEAEASLQVCHAHPMACVLSSWERW